MANRDRDAVNTGLNDILGSVIKTDQRRSGRGQSREKDEAEDHASKNGGEVKAPASLKDPQSASAPVVEKENSSSGDTAALGHYDNKTNGQVIGAAKPSSLPTEDAPSTQKTTSPPSMPKRRAKTSSSGAPPTASSDDGAAAAADRVEVAQALADTPTMTVTLRIPQGFNEWLDEYVHLSWPQKVRKQELVIEALRMLYARRGKAGEGLVETELLGEE